MRARRLFTLLSALVVALLLAGCVQASAVSAPNDPRLGGGLRYGLGPEPNQGTTFQPNVVLVQGGANSVRSVTADGLTWTIDPNAPGVSDLKLGRIMFLTDRGVGKVLALHNNAKGLEVTIGPVTLTDVIKNGKYASAKPIPISQPVAINGKGAFWTNSQLQQSTGISSGVATDVPSTLIRQLPAADQGGPSRAPSSDSIVSDIIKATTGTFDLTGGCCSNGAGVTFSSKKPGLDLEGGVKLAMAKPTGLFHLKIDDGEIKEADLRVGGSLSVTATVHAVTTPGEALRGWSPPLGTDFQFSVPIDKLLGVPLAMTVTQTLNIQVNIPGQAVFNGFGKINLGASVGFSYYDGEFKNGTQAHLDTAASLDGTNSIAVGISYASFWYEVRFNVGIGLLEFVAGVYLSIGVHITAAVGAPIYFNEDAGASSPIEACKSVQSELWTDYGVGYSIPKYVVKIVNAFLKVFNADPMKATGGIGHGWEPIDAHYEVFPKSGFCQKQKPNDPPREDVPLLTIATRRVLIALPVIALSTALLAGCSAGASTPKDAGANGTVKQTTSPAKAAAKPLDTSKFNACTLLPTADAETLVSNKVIAPIIVSTGDVASCTYQGDPNGPLGQVEIYVGDGAKQQLTIDRDNLKHTFTQPTGLGDEAWQEDGWIWSRKGTTWISIRIVVLRDSSLFVTPLQTAMATALKNLPKS